LVWQNGSQTNINIYGSRISPAGQVLDEITVSSAAGMQNYPFVCFDGKNSFVVWQDYRNNPNEPDIYAARVKPDGTVLDSEGRIMTQAARDEFTPALGFDGTNFLVVWEDHRNGSPDIYGARVTPGGTVLDPDGLAITQAASDQTSPALVFDGANFLVVWRDCRTSAANPDIYGARVTPDGAVMDMAGFAITQAPTPQGHPGVGFDGTDFLVVWEDHRSGAFTDLYGARVTRDGTVLDPDGIAVSSAEAEPECPAVSFDGTNFLVVWDDYRYDQSGPDICGARVSPEGVVLDTGGLVICAEEGYQLVPAAGFDGTNFLVAWSEESRRGPLCAVRVSPSGDVLDSAAIHIADSAFFPAIARGTTSMLVVWQSYRNLPRDTDDVYCARVSPSGVVLDTVEIALATAPGWQGCPVAAFDGTDFLVAWGGGGGISGARVSQTGVVFDSG